MKKLNLVKLLIKVLEEDRHLSIDGLFINPTDVVPLLSYQINCKNNIFFKVQLPTPSCNSIQEELSCPYIDINLVNSTKLIAFTCLKDEEIKTELLRLIHEKKQASKDNAEKKIIQQAEDIFGTINDCIDDVE